MFLERKVLAAVVSHSGRSRPVPSLLLSSTPYPILFNHFQTLTLEETGSGITLVEKIALCSPLLSFCLSVWKSHNEFALTSVNVIECPFPSFLLQPARVLRGGRVSHGDFLLWIPVCHCVFKTAAALRVNQLWWTCQSLVILLHLVMCEILVSFAKKKPVRLGLFTEF